MSRAAAGPADADSIEAEALAAVEPTADQRAAMAQDAEALARQADARLRALRVEGQATVQGSVAKGTWLRGAGDIDLFLLLDASVPESRLESVAEEVGKGLLSAMRKRYAQHPYLMGEFRGRTVDLVPAYRVAAATAKMSAVDRTPFHTAWVLGHLDAAARGQARLAKQWMKGVGVYGAQTAVGGFSGYLAEVLVARFATFRGVAAWLAGGASPRRIALGPDQVTDTVSGLVVVDPVDPARNCAAAVQAEVLDAAVAAAKAYLARPDPRFFFPAPPRAEPAASLRAALQRRGQSWLGLLLRPRTARLDIVLPQFQKGARAVAAALGQAGFPVSALQCMASPDETQVLLQWRAEARELPPTRLHRGPAAAIAQNAERFRQKWESHPDTVGAVRVAADGRLEVEVAVPQRTAQDWLRAHLGAVPLGRHVVDALQDSVFLAGPEETPAPWGPAVAEFVLDRHPWER